MVADILHFSAFCLGLYGERVLKIEQLYALMEKVRDDRNIEEEKIICGETIERWKIMDRQHQKQNTSLERKRVFLLNSLLAERRELFLSFFSSFFFF